MGVHIKWVSVKQDLTVNYCHNNYFSSLIINAVRIKFFTDSHRNSPGVGDTIRVHKVSNITVMLLRLFLCNLIMTYLGGSVVVDLHLRNFKCKELSDEDIRPFKIIKATERNYYLSLS